MEESKVDLVFWNRIKVTREVQIRKNRTMISVVWTIKVIILKILRWYPTILANLLNKKISTDNFHCR